MVSFVDKAMPTLAVANQRIQISARPEVQEQVVREVVQTWNPDTRQMEEALQERIVTIDKYVPVFAEPGDVIDVSSWTAIGAYVDRGQISLLGPADRKMAWEAMQREQKEQAERDRQRNQQSQQSQQNQQRGQGAVHR